MDVVVAKETSNGYKIVEIQEIKSGKGDRAVKARKQSDDATIKLQKIENGSNDVQLHRSKNNETG